MQDENSEPQKDSDESEVTGEFMPEATGEYQSDNEATTRFLPGQSTDFGKMLDGLTIRMNAGHEGEPQPEVTDEVEAEAEFGEYRLETRIEIPAALRGRQLSLVIPFTVAPTTGQWRGPAP